MIDDRMTVALGAETIVAILPPASSAVDADALCARGLDRRVGDKNAR
jgi:hypothetical protein